MHCCNTVIIHIVLGHKACDDIDAQWSETLKNGQKSVFTRKLIINGIV